MVPRTSILSDIALDESIRSPSPSLSIRGSSTPLGEVAEKYVRSGDHWHEDGSVVLIAGRVKFKVYSGMLARRSEVFMNLFAIPQPTNGGRRDSVGPGSSDTQLMMDGVPAITLQDDPSELTHLLDLVLPIASPYKPFESPSFEALSATLKLATKYCFDDLREWAMSHVLHRFPHTLDEVAAHPNLSVYKDPVVAARLVNLAHDCDLPKLLPMAFYALASFNWDGSLDLYQKALGYLSSRDQARLGVGRLKMQEDVLSRATTMPENGLTGQHCQRLTAEGHECLIGMPSVIWGNIVERFQSLVRDPIREYGVRMATKGHYYSLCSECEEAVISRSESARKELFESLPSLFQL
ncbi:hypothetical protein FRB95_008442 [Tulasnella sp. JGI-2019a]|nr:hypothetical protein FRB95_008442 [Tulasnella sp. JGI-2019a]